MRLPNVLAWKPRIFFFQEFLTSSQCQGIVNLALRKGLTPAEVGDDPKFQWKRRSSSCWLTSDGLHREEKVLLGNVKKSIAQASMIHENHFETLQVLRYSGRDQYKIHPDFIEDDDPDFLRGGQRLATMLIYLNTIPPGHGGETHFPFAKSLQLFEKNNDAILSNERGVSVRPIEGAACMWYNAHPDGQIDTRSPHAGLGIKSKENSPKMNTKLEKWVLSCWIREKPFLSIEEVKKKNQSLKHLSL